MSTRTRVSRRGFSRVLATGIAAPGLLAAPAVIAQAKAKPLKLATVSSLSGGMARYGQEVDRGVAIALEVINTKGLRIGNTDYAIQNQNYDDKTTASASAELVERVASNGDAQMIIAGIGSVIVKSSVPVAQRLRFPMMALWGLVDGVFATQKQNPYVYGALAPFSRYYDDILQMASKLDNPKIKKAVMIAPNDELGVFTAKEYLPASAKAAGIELAPTEMFPPKSQEYSTILERARRTNADALIINCYTPDIIAFLKEMQAVRYTPPMIIVQNTGTLAEGLGAFANGLVGPSYWDASLTVTKDGYIGTSKDFTALYKAKYGQEPTDYVAALGAHNVIVYSEVLKKAGTVENRQQINNAFRTYDGETFFSAVKFDTDGLNRKGAIYAAQIQDGSLKLVYPEKLRTAPVIYPYPGWKKA
jgi:branched-chain amino acid transport system substrate-binding protein